MGTFVSEYHQMLKPAILLALGLIAARLLHAQITLQQLKDSIQSAITNQKIGTYAVAFKNLDNGEELLINESENFHAASTMKTPVLIEVYKQQKKRKFSLDDSVEVKNEFKSIVDGSIFALNPADDSELRLYEAVGQKKTWRELVNEMITFSSNLATNMIIEFVGAKNVMKTMQIMGANNIQILRGVEDSKAFEKGLNNTTTAKDLMIIFEAIAKGKAVDKKSSQEMVNILLQQHFNTIIPAKLPANVKVAHKTGNITGVFHDSGIVYLPDGRKYVLILLSRNMQDEASASLFLASISEMIYQYVVQKNK
jgi:beta-lactamase class A